MATGPEHYRAAERHLHHAACAAGVEPGNESRHLGYAQVHAALALAAATAVMPWSEEPAAGEYGYVPSDAR